MNQYSSLLLVLLILCVASSKSISSAKVVDVDVICKEAPNPRYCSNLLNSKSRGAKGVDLADLAQYTLEVLENFLTNTETLLAESKNAANDIVLQYYYQCTLDVIDIAIKIGDAERDLYSKQYSSMAKHTAEIMSFILECGDSLHKNKTSPLLAKFVDFLRQVAQVIQTIVNYLNLEK
ncbi:pectinesterase inhibitor [Trifolium repens]|nr:pectinesterase inhibitor [Trifolium repens]